MRTVDEMCNQIDIAIQKIDILQKQNEKMREALIDCKEQQEAIGNDGSLYKKICAALETDGG